MRTISALVFSSFLAVALLGCGSDVPPYWAKLGVTAKGGETRKDMASDQFLVVFYAYDSTSSKRGVHGIRLDATGKPDATGVFPIYLPPTPNDYAREPAVV